MVAELGRPPVKKMLVLDALRNQIVSGELAPGERVPTRRDLSAEHGATLNTVQQALGVLEQDGFVVSRGNRGTFVTDKPPHLNHFALVFPAEPEDSSWGLYWDHLAAVARQVVREQGLRLSIYTGISERQPGEDYERLLKDLHNDRLAGIMFPTAPHEVAGTEILDKPGIPRVVMVPAASSGPEMGAVSLDERSYVAKAARFFRGKGVTSVAILQQPQRDSRRLLTQLKKAAIACPYQFQQAVPLSDVGWARNSMRMLFDEGHRDRPDALIIRDDNLFAPALSGVLDAGLSVPEDLVILTHSNFPWPETSPAPVTRLGYDMHQVLRTFIAELESQRQGNAPRAHRVSAVFEDELPLD